ncbi:PREDICTED: uncharacterized protein LOC105957467 [Erythranthe guttata]|nr:PREDICTED: uncharacterized protein LOC105957467 [Erythranthe guttata]|eukprot:XP_012836844.1 PREDICTED: uncharacterized protein LOC105957467 [Erythranthe guttata]
MDKMIIKIKMPSAMELQFNCTVCERAFGNAKALAGHMRWHLPKAKERKPNSDLIVVKKPKLIAPRPEAAAAESSVARILNCPVCYKSFVSDRAVHGHMKKHPDRNWRGMKPPITDAVPDQVVVVENGDLVAHEFNQLIVRPPDIASAAGWHMTGKRGMAAIAPAEFPETFVVDQSTGLGFDLNEFPPEWPTI